MNLETNAPQMILGTMNFGRQVDEASANRMLELFLDSGYNEIDTAYMYSDGEAEEILGRILTPKRRTEVYLATKVNPFNGGNLRPETIVKQLETSLRRLRADYVDLLYLHAPATAVTRLAAR